MKRIRILFIIRSLNAGGAERQLVMLANGLAERGCLVGVALFYGGGELASDLDGAEVFDLCKKGRWDTLSFFRRLRKVAADFKPDVIHGYLGTANLFATMLKPFVRGSKVVWGIRASNRDLSKYGVVERLHFQAEVLFSRFSDIIIANSEAGKKFAVSKGYPEHKLRVIHNGIDAERFKPDREAGLAVRREWSIPDTVPLVGMVARLDPLKDHQTFLQAAQMIAKSNLEVRFVCVGSGPAPYKKELEIFGYECELEGRILWAGTRLDIAAVMNALDVLCLTSVTEGFPNVLCEAMACGKPCVTTDVGDAAKIVGNTGYVSPAGDFEQMAKAVLVLLREDGCLAQRRRERICSNYSVSNLVNETFDLMLGIEKES